MNRPRRTLVLAVVLALVVAGAGYVADFIVGTLSGYVARRCATAVCLAGADEARLHAEEFADVPWITTTVDPSAGWAEASGPLHLGHRRAWFAPGRGAVLDQRPRGEPPPPELREPAAWEVALDHRLDPVLDAAFAEDPGAPPRRTRGFLVVHQGRIVAERYAAGFSATTPQLGWSMTKSVLNALLGICVRERRLRLDDRALLPEWSDPFDPRARITLEDLLRMRSGLRFSEVYEDPTSDVDRMLFREADMAAFAARSDLEVPIGERWKYSSGTSLILSRILCRAVAPESPVAFARRTLFGPLGMRSAVLECDAAGTPVGSSLLWATPRDWARFGEFFRAGGRWNDRAFLPDGWVDFSVSPTAGSRLGSFGAHWWTNHETAGRRWLTSLPADLFLADGFEGQYVVVVPSRECVIVRMGMCARGAAFPLEEITRRVLELRR